MAVGPSTDPIELATDTQGPSSLQSASSSARTRFPKMKGVGPSKGLWSREWEREVEVEDEEREPHPPARTETARVEKLAGVVPVPVAAMMEGSAWRRSHSMVWPSDLWPSSRVSWKTRAAQMMGMRIRLPRPSTLL